jgi:Cu2+-exporting ATPase
MRQTAQTLRSLGFRLELVSGDRQPVCDWIAAELGIARAQGDVSLADKAEYVRALERQGVRVLYAGDGTNDAPAMREATASVAVAGSSGEALGAAGLVLRAGHVEELVMLLRTGRRLGRIIRQNYAWAFAFNGVFVPLAALGWLRPLWAMLLMLLSSTAVLVNSLRMRSG